MSQFFRFNDQFNIMNQLKINILENGLFYGDVEWNGGSATSPFNRLYFILEGDSFIEYEGENTHLLSGNAYLVPIGAKFDYYCKQSFKQFYLHMRVELLHGIDIFKGKKQIQSMPYSILETKRLIQLAQDGTFSDIVMLKAKIAEVISLFVSQANISLDDENRQKYYELYEEINNNLSANLRIPDIANSLNMNAQTLSKNFKRDIGINIKKQINEILKNRIEELLITTEMSIKQIALELGFSDQYYLSRFFKKQEGISPTAYRENNSYSL